MKKRKVNGYIAVYLNEEERINHTTFSDDSFDWAGWAYEHRYVMEKDIGRKLYKDEVVHHLDCNRSNNLITNLLLLPNKSQHMKLHNWIDNGMPISSDYIPKSPNSNYGKPKPLCLVCNKSVSEYDYKYCSVECQGIAGRRVERPSKKELLELLKTTSFVQLGILYKVSDNAIRKWCKQYGINPKTIRKELKNSTID